jgi:putative alpha-1,2-mannosidase
MVGTMGDVSLADAIVNDIPNFDVAKAYEAIAKDAFQIPPTGVEGVGRVCMESYLKYGYVPRGAPATTGGTCSEVVSRTLNYLQSDYAIAQAALKLGKTDDAAALSVRYNNFSSTFDHETGFFRSKVLGTDKWTVPFDQYAWGDDYTEGGPYQFRFYLPYDPKGLADLYTASGRDMCEELLNVQTAEYSTVHVGGYGSLIHEQTEMVDHCWGQYSMTSFHDNNFFTSSFNHFLSIVLSQGHSNQPVHHMLYQHMYDGYKGTCSNQGRYWIREVLLNLYKADSNMFPGDEDNGEMAAWFVLSSLGLYQRSPGSGNYEFGVPLFGAVEVDISDISHENPLIRSSGKISKEAKTLKIVAKNNLKENTFVQRILWNNEEVSKSVDSFPYSKLAQGGTLVFELGPNPSAANWKK